MAIADYDGSITSKRSTITPTNELLFIHDCSQQEREISLSRQKTWQQGQGERGTNDGTRQPKRPTRLGSLTCSKPRKCRNSCDIPKLKWLIPGKKRLMKQFHKNCSYCSALLQKIYGLRQERKQCPGRLGIEVEQYFTDTINGSNDCSISDTTKATNEAASLNSHLDDELDSNDTTILTLIKDWAFDLDSDPEYFSSPQLSYGEQEIIPQRIYEDELAMKKKNITLRTSAECQYINKEYETIELLHNPNEIELLHDTYEIEPLHYPYYDPLEIKPQRAKIRTLPLKEVLCQCCYQDAVNVVGCNGNHSFCMRCVSKYIEEWLYGGANYQLLRTKEQIQALSCPSPECKLGYLENDAIKKALSPRVWMQYQEKMSCVQRASENGEDYFSVVEENVSDESHDSAMWSSASSIIERKVHDLEEALTNAKVRQCPTCSRRFLKDEDFCNRMKCSRCKTCICYICNQVVDSTGYDHFCKKKEGGCGKCGKCPLWTEDDSKRDDERIRDVAFDVANQIWEESLLRKNDLGTTEEIRIDVERILKK